MARKARILVEFLLEKYTKKESITQSALMKIVNRNYRQHFPEILSTALEHVQLVFGLEMKEVNRRGTSTPSSGSSTSGETIVGVMRGCCPSPVSSWCSWGSSS